MPDSLSVRANRGAARASHEASYVYIGRQPIVARDGALKAYELLFRSGRRNEARVADDAQATAHVVASTIGGVGVAAALGPHRGYVNVGGSLLFDDALLLLPPERFVLEVLETVPLDATVVERLASLRRAGFQIALDDVGEISERVCTALPQVDIVKVDFVLAERAALPAIARQVRRCGKTLVAEKIETREDFGLASELGFELFQGYFFARPQVLRARRSEPSRQSLLRVLALIAGDAPFAELEAELKRNPPVVMQLLRLVNSSAYGFARRIASVREAILAAGTRQIARWAQLLLYASASGLPWRSDPLVQLAGTRSRFMELAASRLRPGDERFIDIAFMTGILSLVHVLFGESTPADTLHRLGLVPEIGDAISHGTGLLGALLKIAEAADAADAGRAQAAVEAAAVQHGELAMFTPALLAELTLLAADWFDARPAS
ncbi:EAL domain-containing protein [Trinickia caryophylli]|uniref:EAL and modified HD-GYP domain-containing signal transduction protein n=1 Tax=Trinickia caryophylli TaxID=28094 RepID=A0A1X7DXM5_TRICW|nr:EAL domain-containing protein [Trinickia caryophylli]PMS14178.1 HDOD domain-containing protein [Trinickia caryophylli]TRX17876.1 EAL domain-containing protein [Trinickia caryophylli]WQE11354.1 EAL domain-containing protein [Trinickia caryophylli]SMF23522.1 EAL and modified HD-GYP domain-containing signal transduction protein [Trinickia caryophylli]GLU32511.1 cyclic diguanylate phosphodiesterase [Trinickia caryophylli]